MLSKIPEAENENNVELEDKEHTKEIKEKIKLLGKYEFEFTKVQTLLQSMTKNFVTSQVGDFEGGPSLDYCKKHKT